LNGIFGDGPAGNRPLFELRLRINKNVQGINRKMAKGGVAAGEKGRNKEN
jgi:hypothetical protein